MAASVRRAVSESEETKSAKKKTEVIDSPSKIKAVVQVKKKGGKRALSIVRFDRARNMAGVPRCRKGTKDFVQHYAQDRLGVLLDSACKYCELSRRKTIGTAEVALAINRMAQDGGGHMLG